MELLDKLYTFLSSYWDSKLFLLGHSLVLLSLVKSVRMVIKEANALILFAKGNEAPNGKYETVVVLQRFVHECERQAQQGNFVPMTDFSDRLDSTIDGMISTMHDRANLFLVVGIMGTMWGVFEFATTPKLFEGSTTVVAEGLANSIGKAFPVGIVGVFLTILAQLSVAVPEESLRSAVTQATQKAMARRQLGPNAILAALKEIGMAIAGLQQINSLVEPLVMELKKTLQPVMKTVGDSTISLVSASEAMKVSSEALLESTEKLRTATGSSLDDLNEATTNLRSLLKDTPKVMNSFVEIQEKHKQWLDKYRQDFEVVARALTGATDQVVAIQTQLQGLPATISAIAQKELTQMRQDLASTWTLESKSISEKIYTSINEHYKKVEEQASKVREKIESAQASYDELLASLSQQSERLVDKIMKNVREEAPELTDLYKGLVDHLKEAASTTEKAREELAKWKSGLDKTQEEMQKIHQVLRNSGAEINSALSNGAKAFEQQVGRVARNLEKFDIFQLVKGTRKTNELLRHIAKSNFVLSIQRIFSAELRRLFKRSSDDEEISSVQGHSMEITDHQKHLKSEIHTG